jgi:hypothetical protein
MAAGLACLSHNLVENVYTDICECRINRAALFKCIFSFDHTLYTHISLCLSDLYLMCASWVAIMESDTEIPPKRPRTEKEPNICVICGSGSSIENLNKPRDQESWRTLLKAAEIQQCDAILHHKDATDVPDIFYNLNCRKLLDRKSVV